MIKVISKGLYTTIQDKGRFGYRNIGVPSSGYMDSESAETANLIINNPKDNPLIEATLIGPTLEFKKSAVICITGGEFSPTLNDIKISSYSAIEVNKGDILKINNSSIGSRCYISIQGTIISDTILGSKSFYHQITNSNIIEDGDIFLFKKNIRTLEQKYTHKKFELNKTINVFRGPEFKCLSKESINTLFNEEFSIGINNRMAYNLLEKIQDGVNSIISSGVIPGTVQLTPSGNIIILHRDSQTTGGYPRILQLNEKSLNDLAQLRTGDKIRFKLLN
ncbi:MAG: biotin-dependent carboxyltransferase family protein [Bacteroidota bacterium]|nr:biotin-dependent carboxyltransferase family protein [Bacteroidota bacterium]MEC8611498.1 biotin-dependent carboxyltransferase family protein [Bacteroidota bacterium]|tara:strand:- start:6719 stop:7552 length:834 start_codon:yes stop_codon:yes gene_type:complete